MLRYPMTNNRHKRSQPCTKYNSRYNGIDPDLNHPSFEFLPYGSVSAFISSTSAWPFLSHPSIPSPASQIALPLHWLLNLSSALAFLHDRNITHRSLSLDLLWLRADFSLALFDFSCAAFAREGEETAVETELKMIGCLQFPLDEIDIAYYSAEDALALGRAMDVFYYGTVAWRMLTRTLDGPVGWHLPVQEDGERDWSLTELRKRLADAVESSGPYEPAGMEVARKCWRLEYRDGCEVRRALEKVVEGIGLSVAGDAVEGVAEAVDGFKRTYRPETFLGNGYSGGEYPGSLSSSLFS
jgi:hypothetical protein